MANRNPEISRTEVELFLECKRCFWLDVRHGIKKPKPNLAGNIGSKYDSRIKNYFDECRKRGETPEEIKNLDPELRLFPEPIINKWRNNKIGYLYPKSNITFYGKIDDLLMKGNRLVPLDIKTTISRDFQIPEAYTRQLEFYGYLLEKNGKSLADFGVLYVIRVDIDKDFQKIKEGKAVIEVREARKVELNYEKWDKILEDLINVYNSEEEPDPAENCEFCQRDKKIMELRKT
jgi:CRISPR/Cas system-associated exonuclease Cas4 (RecB family)